jgi:hypothetical protein
MHTTTVVFVHGNSIHIPAVHAVIGQAIQRIKVYAIQVLLNKQHYGHLNTTRFLLHPTCMEIWMNALQNVYIQFFTNEVRSLVNKLRRKVTPLFLSNLWCTAQTRMRVIPITQSAFNTEWFTVLFIFQYILCVRISLTTFLSSCSIIL